MRKSAWAGLGFLLAAGMAWPQQYLISTVAGGGGPLTPVAATSVGFLPPYGAAADGAGNVYFTSGNVVLKVDAAGAFLTRVAGTSRAGYSGDSGQAASAQLTGPRAVAVDGSGNLYIADTGNNAVRKVTPDGIITTLAGQGIGVQLNSPEGVVTDAAGNLYISDTGNCVIRKVDGHGVTTVAGTGTCGYSGDGGSATVAKLNMPAGLAAAPGGGLYVADSGNNVVRRLAVDDTITTAVGTGFAGYFGDGLMAARAQLNAPGSVASDASGNLYIADTANNVIRRVSPGGIITTIAGMGVGAFAGDGGAATGAKLWSPWGVTADPSGNIFIADFRNSRIRKVGAGGTINTFAGNGSASSLFNAPATGTTLGLERGVAVDSSGNIYIADTNGNAVREVTNGLIVTVAGTGVGGYSGDGGAGPAAQLNRPQGVALDSSGNLYIADTGNHAVRKIVSGTITTIAGTGVAGYSGNGGAATSAQLNSPCDVKVDSSGDVFIVDFANNVIREVVSGTINTIAGAYNPGYSGDGAAATSALLNSPTAIALDSSVNIYIADSFNHRIRKVTVSDQFISTVAGSGTPGYSGDGSSATAPGTSLFYPSGVAVDSTGNIFIADTGNNVIRQVSSSGNISTIGGNHTAGYSGDGGSATSASLNGPTGIVLDSSGSVYVADTQNNVVRLLAAPSHPLLSVSVSHNGPLSRNQTGITYTVLVSNAAGAGATSGAVTVNVNLVGLSQTSISGAGWTCTTSCTRSDALAGGSSYSAIVITADESSGGTGQASVQAFVSGGGSLGAGAIDSAAVVGPPSAPSLVSPANGVIGVTTAPVLTWTSTNAASFDVYFGTSSSPSKVATTTGASYSPGPLSENTTYYWQVVAVNPQGSATSNVSSFTTGLLAVGLQFVPVTPCRVVDTRSTGGPLATGSTRSFTIQGTCGIPSAAQAYSLNVTAVPQDSMPFLTLWPAGLPQPGSSTLNSVEGNVVANAALVPAGAGGAVNAYVAGPTDVILDVNGYFAPAAGASFYTTSPCRVADTRGATGQFGGPSLFAGQERDFPILLSSCTIPASASAFSLNFTAVPDPNTNYLGYLTAWPTGQPQPVVSTLNSWTGAIVANAAIVPAGSNGSVSVFASDQTDLVLDTNGYFAPPGGGGALLFYPIAPCRVADTRSTTEMQKDETRSFRLASSSCYVPPSAAAYSLNITVVPDGPLGYLTAWPTGSPQPLASTLNALDARVVANAAIVPAGTGGAVSIYVSNPTQVVIDINGYFAQ